MFNYIGQVKAMRNYLSNSEEMEIGFLAAATDDECIRYLKNKGYGFFVQIDEVGSCDHEQIYIFKTSNIETIFSR